MSSPVVHRPSDSIANKSVTTKNDDDGSLGCFAKLADGTVVVLSCAHVLFANLHSTNLSIYSPTPSSTCCRGTPMADALNVWATGFRGPSSIQPDPQPDNEHPPVETGYETDCAIARMRAAALYTNEIPGGVGMISGTPASGIGVAAPFADLDQPPTDDQIVRFFSVNTQRVHYGVLLLAIGGGTFTNGGARLDPLRWPSSADKAGPDVKPLLAPLVVRPIPGPDESWTPYANGTRRLIFGQDGDSGAVVVNHKNEVIGMICRAGEKPDRPDLAQYKAWRATSGIGLLSPIAPVLAQMKITIPANLSKTTPSAGELVEEELEDPEMRELRAGQRRVGAQLQQSRLGKIILEKLRRRGREVQQILARDRRAQALWQHHQGPALVNHCIRSLRDPTHRIPTEINGRSRAALLRAMAEVLAEHGGPTLRSDIARYRELVLAHAPGLRSLDDVAPLIAALGHA